MMTGMRRTIVVVLFAACQSSAPPATTSRSERSAPAQASCKPEAPIAVEIATTAIGDELEVVARATPTANVPSVELRLVLPAHATALGATTARFGASTPSDTHTLVTRVRVDRRTSEITAVARVPVADVEMARAATIAIGAPAPAARTKAYALPDGELAREVRP
jgi:hypothetical protein